MFNQNYKKILFQVTSQLLEKKKNKKNLFCLVSGPQGSGKTTFTGFIKNQLEKQKLKVLVLSIDDFYLSKQERQKLSNKISPLLLTRGVPGTHNLDHLRNVVKLFLSNKKKKYTFPKFSKADDDHLKSKRNVLNFPYDVFILEGWCVNYPGETKKTLSIPINLLEKNQDSSLKWRKYVNNRSKIYFKSIYQKSHFSIFLKIPNFAHVFKWRKKQEMQIPKKKQMNSAQLQTFISYYERITKRLLQNKKNFFNCEVKILSNHSYSNLKINF